MVTTFLVSNISTALADNGVVDNSANSMSRDMLSFFRKKRTGIDASNISKNEYMVYGVFLSNFLEPGKTTVKDLKGGDTELAKAIAEQFMGDAGQSSKIGELNAKLYEALTHKTDGFGSNSAYNLVDAKGELLNGQGFLEAIAKKSKLKVGSKGGVGLDFSHKAYRGMIQTIFGTVPDLFLDLLPKMEGMYMDGLGNIWGSYKKGEAVVGMDDYVLIIPACVNPTVFRDTKMPIANSFVMGAIINTSQEYLKANNVPKVLPYYNIKSYLGGDSKNMLSVYGIYSPTKVVGNTNSLINGNNIIEGSELVKTIKSFINTTSSKKIDGHNLKVIFSVDSTHIDKASSKINKLFSNNTDKHAFMDYVSQGISYGMGEIADEMYFFADGGTGGIENAGNFGGDDKFLVPKHRMFMESIGNNNYEFYNNAVLTTKWTEFLGKYYSTSDAKKKEELTAYTGGSGVGVDSLNNFLNTGWFEGKLSNTSTSKMESAFALTAGGGAKIYNMLPLADRLVKINDFWILKKSPMVTGMTYNDSYLSEMAFTGASLLDWGGIKTPKPFSSGLKGGKLNDDTPKSQSAVGNLFHTVNTYTVFSMSGQIASKLSGKDVGEKITTPLGNELEVSTKIANRVNNWPGIYWAYMVNMLNVRQVNGSWKTDDYRNDGLPELTINTMSSGFDLDASLQGGVDASDDKTLEDIQKDIIRKIYGLLSETNNNYRDRLIKRTMDSWVLTAHRSIVGSWVEDALVVGSGNAYNSAIGYINTPTLHELPLTAWIIKDYPVVYMFTLLLVLIVIVLMIITNNRTIPEGMVLFVILGVVLMLPQSLLTNVVNITNKVSDSMYSEKFNYWAITQHEKKISSGLSGSTMDATDRLFASSMENNMNITSNDATVTLKWMSPKKQEDFENIFNNNNDNSKDSLNGVLNIFKFMFNGILNQEQYVTNDPMATYLYRPYNAIVSEALKSYNSLASSNVDSGTIKGNIQRGKNSITGVPSYRYDAMFGNISNPIPANVESKIKAYKTSDDIKDDYKYWALGNLSVTDAIFRKTYELDNAGLSGYMEDAYGNAFLLSTESPFYYFYNVLKTRYSTVNGSFKSALLKEEVFKTKGTGTDADGEVKDFLDMENMFSYLIPYLQQSNDYVNGWTKVHGSKIEDYDFNRGTSSDEYVEKYAQAKNKKNAMMNVWKMYSPWVDALEENDKISKISWSKKIGNTINPGSYNQSGVRQMCFSPAEMEYRNLNKGVMSHTEGKIHRVLEKTYEDMMYLINYYDFSDEVLISMSAMMATFNFNQEFSDNKIIGESTLLYPQGLELKNFNFDAFLRLMIMNATGEPLIGEGDLFDRVLTKTSFFTGVLLILVDILAVVVIPAVKIIILVLMFLLVLVLSLGCILTPPENIGKKVLNALLKPIGLFMVSVIGFAFIISMFMGEGFTGYVGSKTPTVGITDPTVLLLMMVIVSCAYIFVLFKVVGMLNRGLKDNTTLTVMGGVGVLTGAVSLGSKLISGKLGSSSSNVPSTTSNVSNDGEVNNSSVTSNSTKGNKGIGTDGYNGNSKSFENGEGSNLTNEIDELARNPKDITRGSVSFVDKEVDSNDEFKDFVNEKSRRKSDSEMGLFSDGSSDGV